METAVEVPIRVYQVADGDNQYAVVEWIIEGEDNLCLSFHDDSGDTTPYFMDGETDLVIRKADAGHLVCDIFAVTDDMSQGEKIATAPFAIRSPEAWPDEWTNYLNR